MTERQQDSTDISTADVAAAANRASDRSTAELERLIDDREVERDRAVEGTADLGVVRGNTPLLATELVDDFRSHWTDIQAAFVDEPRRAVERADGLVADAIKQLADSFANERARLEGQWDRGGDVSTEDLRQAFQRYRSFFS